MFKIHCYSINTFPYFSDYVVYNLHIIFKSDPVVDETTLVLIMMVYRCILFAYDSQNIARIAKISDRASKFRGYPIVCLLVIFQYPV